eukprot:TRINITY_DN1805_c0_g1_i1.p1 TRINITY_DN1805_c0_g1~~TRINITY_DN1805_c0_g1_i1.p1  ORF type:complete len:325 (+),score=65.13 TRINITY_DN1805_c0_g1_i1:121-1095(+)
MAEDDVKLGERTKKDVQVEEEEEEPAPTLPQVRNRFEGHGGKVYGCAWGPDSRSLVSVGQDGKMLVTDVVSGATTRDIGLVSNWVMCCDYSPAGSFLSCGGLENVVYVYNAASAPEDALVKGLQGHDGYVASCVFVSEIQIISTSGDARAALWDIPSGRVLSDFKEHTADVMCSALAPNKHVFVTGSCDRTVKLWDTRQQASTKTLLGHENDVNTVAFLSDGNTVISGSDDSTCRMYDIRTSSAATVFADEQHHVAVTSVDVSRSGKTLYVAHASGPVKCWNIVTGKAVGDLSGHENRISTVRVSPDGTTVATAGWDGKVVVWS